MLNTPSDLKRTQSQIGSVQTHEQNNPKAHNNKMINIAFFGTSDRSIEILESLYKDFNLAFTLTKPDTKIGRHQDTHETAVKTWSKINNVEYLELSNLKSPNDSLVINKLIEHKVSVVIVADYSLIIPNTILSTQKIKMLNIHFSLLPKYRGASPIQFALLNGDTVTGVTFQFLHEKMDRGDIIKQFPVKIIKDEDASALTKRLFTFAAEHTSEVVESIVSNTYNTQKQIEENASYTYSKHKPKSTLVQKDDARINWNKSDVEIYNHIRAFAGWPTAWTTYSDFISSNYVKTYDTRILLSGNHFPTTRSNSAKNAETKRLESSVSNIRLTDENNLNKRIKILKCSLENNVLFILQVQPEGKNLMDFQSFLNGYFNAK